MDSPFYNSKTITMYLEPYLNTEYQSYQNIITLSGMPNGPLSEMVKMLSFRKLSPFQTASIFNTNSMNCTFALLRYPKTSFNNKGQDQFMTADDIPAVISYLIENGYSINSDLTNMLQKSNIKIGGNVDNKLSGNRKMICLFTYK